MRRWWAAAFVGLVAGVTLTGCGGNPAGVDGTIADDWVPLSAPKQFVPENDVCHANAVESGYLAAYAPIDCATSHLVQTVHVGAFPDGDSAWPTQGSKPYQAAFAECGKRASSYVGGDWRGGRLSLTMVTPPPEAWKGGARWYRCDVAETRSLDDTSMVSREGSVKDALKAASSPMRFGCFTPRLAKELVEEMVPTPCNKAHRSEFVGIYEAPASSYGAFTKNTDTIHRACLNVVASYAKVPRDSNLVYRSGTIYYYPTETEWNQGNRGVKCFSWDSSRNFTKSIKGGGTKALPIN